MPTTCSEELQRWIGRCESSTDVIALDKVAGLAATLDGTRESLQTGDVLPPCWHWLFFLSNPTRSDLGTDGHAQRGGFLPPVSLPRRMWAGSKIDFLSPLHIGDTCERRSTVTDIQHKKGASGALVFVTVQHEITARNVLAIRETQTIVYREAVAAPPPAAPTAIAYEPQWSSSLAPDAVLLFRYSALTWNSHRIHYDMRYAQEQEGYPGLVVQGPLTASLLLELLHVNRRDVSVAQFQFRGRRPLIEGEMISLQGCIEADTAHLWAVDASGSLSMEASATLSLT